MYTEQCTVYSVRCTKICTNIKYIDLEMHCNSTFYLSRQLLQGILQHFYSFYSAILTYFGETIGFVIQNRVGRRGIDKLGRGEKDKKERGRNV